MAEFKQDLSLKEIERYLRRLGIARHYKGFSRLAYAVYLVLQNEDRLEAIVKEVYIPVAEFCGCSWSAVERSLRILCTHLWLKQRDTMYEATGIKFQHYPIPSELLDTISIYIKDNHT